MDLHPYNTVRHDSGLQAEDFDTKVEDEDYVTQKPQMQHNEEKEQMKDLEVNTILNLKL
jgi:hypothetical protein